MPPDPAEGAKRSVPDQSTTPVPITVIAAVRNEMSQIEEWLEHLRWVSRVVLVDTGSRDGTREWLQERGVELIEAPDAELIHAAKNLAIDRVTEGWILDLDLDERVTGPLAAEIQHSIGDSGSEVAGFEIPFRHYVFGRWLRHGGWRTRHLRLYRAGRARYPEDRAHSTLRVDGDVRPLDSHVVHFAHPQLHDFVTKMNRYTSQDAPLIREHGRGGLRNRAPLGPKRLRWLRAAASVFWGRYIRHSGFRDGVPGLMVATLLSFYVFVEQAKVWEQSLPAPANDG